ncbi:Hypothetical protein GLP15_994 [Giardia lamblia P15]|uniref:C3H1-type domain-containing protein n=1 Tax=Giardia intestinalis (strain P15) TaxID=658858 RepID=E1F338_GIAIA|nr:Hypothetical protein GLP15_994 [Giardia lamblia P15]
MDCQDPEKVLAWAMNITARLLPGTTVQRRSITREEADRKYKSTELSYDAQNSNLTETPVDVALDDATIFSTLPDSTELSKVRKTKTVPHGVCKDFYETGYCRFGDACIYSHIREADL